MANPNVTVAGEERAAGEVNYLLGDDASRWQRGLSQYRQVVYRDLWSGIDLKLREDSGALKYEFRVRPGARVSDIRLAYEGVEGMALDAARRPDDPNRHGGAARFRAGRLIRKSRGCACLLEAAMT